MSKIKWYIRNTDLYCDNHLCICGVSSYHFELLRYKGYPEDRILPDLLLGDRQDILVGDDYEL